MSKKEIPQWKRDLARNLGIHLEGMDEELKPCPKLYVVKPIEQGEKG